MLHPSLVIPEEKLDCPVLKEASEVLDHANNLRASINHLRRSMAACTTCPNSGDCLPLQDFNRQIDHAIETLAKEWGLE